MKQGHILGMSQEGNSGMTGISITSHLFPSPLFSSFLVYSFIFGATLPPVPS